MVDLKGKIQVTDGWSGVKENGFEISLIDNGIIQIKFEERHETTVSDLHILKDTFVGFEEVNNGHPVLVLTGRKSRMSADARHTDIFGFADYNVSKLAIVIQEFIPMVLGKWYMKYVTQPKFEYKIFTNKDEATIWLKEMM